MANATGSASADQTTVDNIAQKLQALQTLLQESTGRVQGATDSIAKHREHADAVAAALPAKLAELATAWQGAATELEAGHEEIEQQASALLDACQQHQTACEQKHEEVVSHIGDASTQAQTAAGDHDAHESDVTSGTDNVAQSIQERIDTLASEWSKLEDGAIAQFTNDSTHALAEAGEAFESATQALTDWTAHLGDDLKSRVGEFMTQFRTSAGGDIESQLTSAFGDTKNTLDGGFSTFTETLQHCADHFGSEVETLVRDVIDHAQHKAADELRAAFEEVAKDALERLASEVVEQVATMQIGVATTTTLGPIIPELIAAKQVLSVINNFLASIDGHGAGA